MKLLGILCVMAVGCANSPLATEVDAGLDSGPNSCNLNVLATRSVAGLGARCDTAKQLTIYQVIPRDCGGDPWLYHCAYNDLTISCRGHEEVWSIDEGDSLIGYEVTVVVNKFGLPTVERYKLGTSGYDFVSRKP